MTIPISPWQAVWSLGFRVRVGVKGRIAVADPAKAKAVSEDLHTREVQDGLARTALLLAAVHNASVTSGTQCDRSPCSQAEDLGHVAAGSDTDTN